MARWRFDGTFQSPADITVEAVQAEVNGWLPETTLTAQIPSAVAAAVAACGAFPNGPYLVAIIAEDNEPGTHEPSSLHVEVTGSNRIPLPATPVEAAPEGSEAAPPATPAPLGPEPAVEATPEPAPVAEQTPAPEAAPVAEPPAAA